MLFTYMFSQNAVTVLTTHDTMTSAVVECWQSIYLPRSYNPQWYRRYRNAYIIIIVNTLSNLSNVSFLSSFYHSMVMSVIMIHNNAQLLTELVGVRDSEYSVLFCFVL